MTDEQAGRPLTPFQERLGRVAVQLLAGTNRIAFRLSRGRTGGHVPGGAPICLLTTTGRRTGRARTVPLLYLPHDGSDHRRGIVVVASRGGMSCNPDWYLNLQADPRAVVEIGTTRRAMVARPATEVERTRFWPRLSAVYPRFLAYQRRTDRRIPVLILVPVGPAASDRTRPEPPG